MSDVSFFFSGWTPVVRIVVVGVAMYVALVAFLRTTGSRSLASMNAFDFVVTVAIGAAFGRSLTAESVALAEAVMAFALLLFLQFVVGWVQVRSRRFEDAITNPPALLYFRDGFLRGEMRNRRVTEDQLRGAVRKRGFGSLDDVEAIVLETTGEVSVVESVGDGSALGAMAGASERDSRGSEP